MLNCWQPSETYTLFKANGKCSDYHQIQHLQIVSYKQRQLSIIFKKLAYIMAPYLVNRRLETRTNALSTTIDWMQRWCCALRAYPQCFPRVRLQFIKKTLNVCRLVGTCWLFLHTHSLSLTHIHNLALSNFIFTFIFAMLHSSVHLNFGTTNPGSCANRFTIIKVTYRV